MPDPNPTPSPTGGSRWLFTILTLTASLAAAPLAGASDLSLAEAERLALAQDPSIRAVEANRTALGELAVAADQLPDPMVKAGFMSLPTDTFRLDQEPMTQVQVGVIQKFPRGQSRALTAQGINQQSEALGESIRDQRLRILLATREQFLEILKQRRLAEINADAVRAFSDLADIIRDYYATGRVHQGDVLQAEVEMAKVIERASRITEEEERARAILATWIGKAAFANLVTNWPDLPANRGRDALVAGLGDHPRLAALSRRVDAAETGVELARQRYKPEFSVDVTYGGRSAMASDGRSLPDLLSLMVTMDVPLFTTNRQDRVTAARVAETSAVQFEREDAWRRMVSDIEFHAATAARQDERIELFETTLLPQAAYSAESSFDAYQSSVGDLTTLLRAQITEFELKLDHARLQAERLKTRARLLYLEGGNP